MRRRTLSLVLVLATWSAAVGAQGPSQRTTQLIAASNLPVVALDARRDGVRDDEVRGALDAMRRKNVPAHEARTLFDEERKARRDHGPVNNFGAFVQSKLDAGLRGRDLAAAIRAEHAARGRGRGTGQVKGQTKGQSQTRPQSPARGRPGTVTKSAPGAKAPAARSKAPAATRRAPGGDKAPATKGKTPQAAGGSKGRPAPRPTTSKP